MNVAGGAAAVSAEHIHYLGLVELSKLIRSGAVTSAEATAAILSRIAEIDGSLGSYTTVLADRAMARARAADAEIAGGFWRGPLHGVPIAVKDLCYTVYAPTSAGMEIRRGFMAPHNATVVDRLERAGAVILGKLTMTEGAFSGHHPKMPTPLNPWNRDAWTGASSSGSGVATAAGLCFASLGSDTGGSIRLPSGACGITGLKPTWGRVSRYGVFALAESLDHIGPMTRSAEDAAAMLAVIAGADKNDPTALVAPVPDYLGGLGAPIRGVRIGLDRDYVFSGTDPEVAKAMEAAIAAFADLGARIVPVEFPSLEGQFDAWTNICCVEAAIAHEETYPVRAAQYGPQLSTVIETGRKVSAFDLGKALHARQAFSGRLADLFATVDLLIAPVIPGKVPSAAEWAHLTSGAVADISGFIRFTGPFDMSGSPTITLPGGFDGNGVPIGFQLVGRHLGEDLLLRAGHAFQKITDWHTRHPQPGRAAA